MLWFSTLWLVLQLYASHHLQFRCELFAHFLAAHVFPTSVEMKLNNAVGLVNCCKFCGSSTPEIAFFLRIRIFAQHYIWFSNCDTCAVRRAEDLFMSFVNRSDFFARCIRGWKIQENIKNKIGVSPSSAVSHTACCLYKRNSHLLISDRLPVLRSVLLGFFFMLVMVM